MHSSQNHLRGLYNTATEECAGLWYMAVPTELLRDSNIKKEEEQISMPQTH